MLSKIPARKLAHKAVAAAVICGAVAVGTGGAAFAATTTTSSSTPTTHVKCARAPKALSKVNKVEARITKRLATLQATETRQTAAGHTKLAARTEKRITRLQKAQTKAGTVAGKIQTKCPGTVAAST